MKKILALVLAVLMMVSTCMVVSAESNTMQINENDRINLGAGVKLSGGEQIKVIAVDISWEPNAESWEYYGGVWDPAQHRYVSSEDQSIGWVGTTPGYVIKMENHSNCNVRVKCDFVPKNSKFYNSLPSNSKTYSSIDWFLFGWNVDVSASSRRRTEEVYFFGLGANQVLPTGEGANGDVVLGDWIITVYETKE